jgi:hypothetical protein
MNMTNSQWIARRDFLIGAGVAVQGAIFPSRTSAQQRIGPVEKIRPRAAKMRTPAYTIPHLNNQHFAPIGSELHAFTSLPPARTGSGVHPLDVEAGEQESLDLGR